MSLPTEIVLQILTYIPSSPSSQPTLYTVSLLSRTFYLATTPRLYHTPFLTSATFLLFIRTLCPSINAHITPTPLASLVEVLDLSHLLPPTAPLGARTKSLTARLLSRVRPTLKTFIAPPANFSLNQFTALSKCTALVRLDLRSLSEYIALDRLFAAISPLPHLTHLYLSRSTTSNDLAKLLSADLLPSQSLPHGAVLPILPAPPSSLTHLHISGNTTFPAASFLSLLDLHLSTLHVSDCRLSPHIATVLLSSSQSHWEHRPHALELGPRLEFDDWMSLASPLINRPGLHTLSLIGNDLVAALHSVLGFMRSAEEESTIEELILRATEGEGDLQGTNMIVSGRYARAESVEDVFRAGSLYDAVGERGLRKLRRLRMGCWARCKGEHEDLLQDMKDLADLMEALAREDSGEGSGGGDESGEERMQKVKTGVWINCPADK